MEKRDCENFAFAHAGPEAVRLGIGVGESGAGITTRRFGLIKAVNESVDRGLQYPDAELFDLQGDPRERRSVFGQPNYTSVQKELRSELARLHTKLRAC